MTKKHSKKYFVHKTAIIENDVQIGEGTKIWHFAQVRRGSKIGKNCVIGKSVFIDFGSEIGENVKIQNHAIVYHKAIIEDGVFIGPNVCFTNDKIPRAINPDGTAKSADDWHVSTIRIGEGASVGGHTVLLPGITIGKFAMIGSGAVVTKNVPDYALAYGNPARIKDFVCRCGKKLNKIGENEDVVLTKCSCGIEIVIPRENYKLKDESNPPAGGKKRIWIR
ncbi:acetyltransferase [Candidatus Berkelbacteria bacterium RBG_13_40_8]|uniref:Acetyltransferase n=1 Tax=Candidatus Berkelbacteria bacterium RBG_13_40_8 TaxID=1797467 RepID=A0A1F5DNH7_9BACT|nr:MAG: acetyltransferase [Candidatus Berkelbacteria bacterium RBG_13_40_8]